MKRPLFITQILHFEYWNWLFFYTPMIPYWLYQSFRARSLTFFTAVNPGIEAGGFYGEKKTDIYDQIPEKYLPKIVLIKHDADLKKVYETLQFSGIEYPFFAKPNVGGRGRDVVKIHNQSELNDYHQFTDVAYLIQEFIDYVIELGILYSRHPDEAVGQVSSITFKEFLTVVGDGKATILELMQENIRARFNLDTLKIKHAQTLNEVLPKNEKRILENVGNHWKGTKFLNANYLISNELNDVFYEIVKNYEGFYYGRFDLKVDSIADLFIGKNIKII